MNVGTSKNTTDRDAASRDDIPMQFVAAPVVLMALAVGFDTDTAFDGQVGDHLIQRHLRLAVKAGAALASFGAGMSSTTGFGLLFGVGGV